MKRRLLIGAVLTVTLACTVLLAATVLPPLQTVAASASAWVSDILGGEWKMRYEEAQAALTDTRTLRAERDELRRRNAWYHEFLGLKAQNSDFALAEGQVIAADPSDPYGGFTVNIGALDGVPAGAPVITENGLVGFAHTIGPNWTRVRTLYHPEVSVSVIVSRTGEIGQTAGGSASQYRLTVDTLPWSTTAGDGDLLITSGLGGACPRGLLVGEALTVTHHSDGLTDIATAVPCQTVLPDRVMIITDFTGKLP